jgi:hypothetical protein
LALLGRDVTASIAGGGPRTPPSWSRSGDDRVMVA